MSLDISKVSKHKTQHQDGGVDEISVAALSGELADRQPSKVGTSILGWTDEKVLKGAGAGVAPDEIDVPTAVTKELWVPVTYASTALSSYGDYAACQRINAVADHAHMSFKVPWDFTSIVSAHIIGIPGTTGAMNWDIYSDYAAEGQSYVTHSESDEATTYNTTLNQIFAVNIAGILTALAADDYVGVRIKPGTDGHDMYVLGVRFRYT